MKKALLFMMSLLGSAGPVVAGCPYGMMQGCGHQGFYGGFGSPVLFLATLALGFWLLRTVEREDKKFLKGVGRAVSWIILIVSLYGLIWKLGGGWCLSKHGRGYSKGVCSFHGMMDRDDDDDDDDDDNRGPAAAPRK
jgi:hypothetical protein